MSCEWFTSQSWGVTFCPTCLHIGCLAVPRIRISKRQRLRPYLFFPNMKSKGLAYVLWFFFGWAGIHRFYVGKVVTGVIYLFTGGLLGFGWFIDLFLLGGYVDTYNAMFMARTAVNNTNANVNNVVVNIPGHLTAPQQPTQTAQPAQATQKPQTQAEEGNNSSC